MTPKRQRLLFAIFGMGFLIGATLLILNAFSENLVFFFTPTDVREKGVASNQFIRLGGLVEKGSVVQEGKNFSFTITDMTETMKVRFTGIPPALFREGQGVIAEGYAENGSFRAVKLLAKHDENYMPPEVAQALKKAGHTQNAD